MPVLYEVFNHGHFIHAIVSGMIHGEEFFEYEAAHAIDERIKPPVCELLGIRFGVCRMIAKSDFLKALERRNEQEKTRIPHACAIVVAPGGIQTWDPGGFYEGMGTLHFPEKVIVFGEIRLARTWLGQESVPADKTTPF